MFHGVENLSFNLIGEVGIFFVYHIVPGLRIESWRSAKWFTYMTQLTHFIVRFVAICLRNDKLGIYVLR